jgi:hypothetical protein
MQYEAPHSAGFFYRQMSKGTMPGISRSTCMTRRSDSKQQTYSAEKARQGEIILRTPLRRFIFIAGLAGMVILAIVLSVFSYH